MASKKLQIDDQLNALAIAYALFALLGVAMLFLLPLYNDFLEYAVEVYRADPYLRQFAPLLETFRNSLAALHAVTIVTSAMHLFGYGFIGYAIYRRRWYKTCVGVSWVTVLLFPVGTAIGVLALSLLKSPQARQVFSEALSGSDSQ